MVPNQKLLSNNICKKLAGASSGNKKEIARFAKNIGVNLPPIFTTLEYTTR